MRKIKRRIKKLNRPIIDTQLIMKNEPYSEGMSGPVEPTFTIPANFLDDEFKKSLTETLKKMDLYDKNEIGKLKGLIMAKNSQISYFKELIDKLLNMISGRNFK